MGGPGNNKSIQLNLELTHELTHKLTHKFNVLKFADVFISLSFVTVIVTVFFGIAVFYSTKMAVVQFIVYLTIDYCTAKSFFVEISILYSFLGDLIGFIGGVIGVIGNIVMGPPRSISYCVISVATFIQSLFLAAVPAFPVDHILRFINFIFFYLSQISDFFPSSISLNEFLDFLDNASFYVSALTCGMVIVMFIMSLIFPQIKKRFPRNWCEYLFRKRVRWNFMYISTINRIWVFFNRCRSLFSISYFFLFYYLCSKIYIFYLKLKNLIGFIFVDMFWRSYLFLYKVLYKFIMVQASIIFRITYVFDCNMSMSDFLELVIFFNLMYFFLLTCYFLNCSYEIFYFFKRLTMFITFITFICFPINIILRIPQLFVPYKLAVFKMRFRQLFLVNFQKFCRWLTSFITSIQKFCSWLTSLTIYFFKFKLQNFWLKNIIIKHIFLFYFLTLFTLILLLNINKHLYVKHIKKTILSLKIIFNLIYGSRFYSLVVIVFWGFILFVLFVLLVFFILLVLLSLLFH